MTEKNDVWADYLEAKETIKTAKAVWVKALEVKAKARAAAEIAESVWNAAIEVAGDARIAWIAADKNKTNKEKK